MARNGKSETIYITFYFMLTVVKLMFYLPSTLIQIDYTLNVSILKMLTT